MTYDMLHLTGEGNPPSSVASARKENNVSKMTNEQFKTFIKMIIQIIKDSESKEDAIEKIKALLNK